MSEERKLVQRYLRLSEDYESRPLMARRGMLGPLVKFLDNNDWEVRHAAAKTISNLAQHEQNARFLCDFPNFIPTLYTQLNASESTDPELNRLIHETFQVLRPALEDTLESADVVGAPAKSTPSRQFTVGDRHTIELAVEGLTEVTASGVRDIFRELRGVVSYHFDIPEGTVNVFGSIPTETVLKALKSGGFPARVVFESEPESAPVLTLEGGYRPPLMSKLKINADTNYKRSIVLAGGEDGIVARLTKKKGACKGNKDSAGVLGSVMSTLKSWW